MKILSDQLGLHLRHMVPLLLVALLLAGCKGKGNDEELTPELIRNGTLTFYLKIDGGLFTVEDAWHLMRMGDGETILTILRFPHSAIKEISPTKEQIKELREALITERLFEVRDEFGDTVTDQGFRGVRMTIGGFIKSIELRNYDCATMDPAELDELRRVLRIWKLVRGWFDATSIVSYEEADRLCLEEE